LIFFRYQTVLSDGVTR